MSLLIRRLEAGDFEAYRAIRLEGLRDVPKAFGDDYEDALKRNDAYWRDSLSGDAVHLGAFDGDQLVGILNYVRLKPRKLSHNAMLYGVYVSPAARGTGAGEKLINAALDDMKAKGVLQVFLGVGAFNAPAIGLYERLGFARIGTEPRALYVDDEFIDEHQMVRFLDKDE